MRVKVRYLGPVRVMLNKKEEDVELSLRSSLLDLLRKLSSYYGDGFRDEVLEENGKQIREGLIITVNGIATGQLGCVGMILKEGDMVTLLPFFAGGG